MQLKKDFANDHQVESASQECETFEFNLPGFVSKSLF